jgi:AraC family transcriptional regulator of adaptative response/methylated-DNA-[protein]-cysteine methyltransferase
MLRAFEAKDPEFDGVFFVAVKTTNVFCRPVCRAKPARPENVEFFPSAAEAMYHGYRPCKLCRPLDAGQRPPEVVDRLMKLIDASPETRLRERDLRELKIDPSTARRQFKSYCRMTFSAYQRARRMGTALREVRSGSPLVSAQVGAGYESSSGFRDAFARLFGTGPSNGQSICVLTSRWIDTPLGAMLAIASDDGVALLDFADRKGLERAILHVRSRFGARGQPAVIVPGPHEHLDHLERELAEYFSGAREDFTVPLVPRGSEFERRAWDYLRSIEYGQTRSYLDEAKALGNPRAVRPVGRANGMNYIAILIPCHRVIASNGDLTGYGGGLARKRWLIDHERKRA